MATSNVTFQNGDFKHPYLLALVRWCVSSFWTTATVILHRIITAPIPPIKAPKPIKARPASSDHLHPEPTVDCVVLHTPADHTIDVIFVHGLYGSLGNTWRQGEWMSRYDKPPTKVPLRRPHSTPTCKCPSETSNCNENNQNDQNTQKSSTENNQNTQKYENTETKMETMYGNIQKILPDDLQFTAEKFYNSTMLKSLDISSYETQAQFVKDMFESDARKPKIGGCKCPSTEWSSAKNSGTEFPSTKNSGTEFPSTKNSGTQFSSTKYSGTEFSSIECECSSTNFPSNEYPSTECLSTECLSTECPSTKCPNECNGCGCVCDECYSPCWPRDWIKVDHPGARVISVNYTSDPYLWRPLWIREIKRLRLHDRAEQMISQLLDLGVGERPTIWVGHSKGGLFIKQIYCEAFEAHKKLSKVEKISELKTEQNTTECKNDNLINHSIDRRTDRLCDENCDSDLNSDSLNNNVVDRFECDRNENVGNQENEESITKRAKLWSNSLGFMFYSVPHRGSPLADIKTPITARSIELMEIAKDCNLVLTLQDRWLQAVESSQPAVRSLVETCRTLMSVLYLRIVSVDSADPGIGALYGVSVDHREICKPSSRQCLLYKELMTLMDTALKKKQQ